LFWRIGCWKNSPKSRAPKGKSPVLRGNHGSVRQTYVDVEADRLTVALDLRWDVDAFRVGLAAEADHGAEGVDRQWHVAQRIQPQNPVEPAGRTFCPAEYLPGRVA
jgi:hypothetical protein